MTRGPFPSTAIALRGRRHHLARAVATIGALALVAGACGGDDDTADSTTTTVAVTVAPTTLPPATTTTAPPTTTTTIALVTEGATVLVANASGINGRRAA